MNKPWLKNYPKDVPPEVDVCRYTSIASFFDEVCCEHKHKTAYSHEGVHLSYQRLHALSSQFAVFLQDQGFQKGDRIALMMPNLLQYPVALYAALKLGLVVVNINPLFTPAELLYELNDAKPKAIVIFSHFANTLEKILHELPALMIITTDFADLFPAVKRVISSLVIKYVLRLIPHYRFKKAFQFRDALSCGKKRVFQNAPLSLSDLAFLQYTGGTTGVAKAAMLTHGNMLANVMQVHAWFKPAVTVGEEVLIAALPIYHIFTLMVNCLLFLRFGAENVLITNPRDIKGLVKRMSKTRFTGMIGVNLLFKALLNNAEFKKFDFSSLHLAVAGGAALTQAVADDWLVVTGKPLLQGYGLTEASPVVTVDPLRDYVFDGSIGLPLPSTDIKIMDETGHACEFNCPGELYVKGPQVMQGYWGREDETRKVLTEDDWLKTGDIAVLNDQGFLRIVDRKKDLINVSGFKVYPAEIETVIAKIPEVSEVAVIAVVSEVQGESVVAVIVTKQDSALTQEDVKDFCHQQLTGYKVPKIVKFVDQLPKTNVGKISRKLVRENYFKES